MLTIDTKILVIVFLVLVNTTSFILFALDKSKAEKKMWRISERILLGISFLGGSTGALMAMVIFKHKLSKKKFYIGIPCMLVLNKIVELILFINI